MAELELARSTAQDLRAEVARLKGAVPTSELAVGGGSLRKTRSAGSCGTAADRVRANAAVNSNPKAGVAAAPGNARKVAVEEMEAEKEALLGYVEVYGSYCFGAGRGGKAFARRCTVDTRDRARVSRTIGKCIVVRTLSQLARDKRIGSRIPHPPKTTLCKYSTS